MGAAFPSDQDASGRTLGSEELAAVSAAIESGTLTSTKGSFVKEFERRFAEHLGSKYAFACASGSAAVHCAIAAIDPEPGDEVVTTAITDMGALTPILYQGAIPVFADVDPRTYNVTAATIEARLSERTRAIVVTHLFGNPCEMAAIQELGRARGVPVIEDAAQAFGARFDGRRIGTLGSIGCFSLQQGKHITTGEGGVVVTDDDDLARRLFLFINKAWGYGDPAPDHYFLALNYRLSELQGAVAVAQLDKLEGVVERRRELAADLDERLNGVDGIALPRVPERGEHSYWRYCLDVDPDVIDGGVMALAAGLRERGVFCAPRYIQKPAFECEVFRDRRTFGASGWPFTEARAEALDWAKERFPGTYAALSRILVLPWNERYTGEHVEAIAQSVREESQRRVGARS